MPSLEASGTQAATVGVEHLLATVTSNKTLVFMVDANAMTNGNSTDAADELELKIETSVLSAGASRVAYLASFFGAQAEPILISVPVPSDIQSIFRLKQTAGVDRSFPWKVLGL